LAMIDVDSSGLFCWACIWIRHVLVFPEVPESSRRDLCGVGED
jgi:hypothetical protein